MKAKFNGNSPVLSSRATQNTYLIFVFFLNIENAMPCFVSKRERKKKKEQWYIFRDTKELQNGVLSRDTHGMQCDVMISKTQGIQDSFVFPDIYRNRSALLCFLKCIGSLVQLISLKPTLAKRRNFISQTFTVDNAIIIGSKKE